MLAGVRKGQEVMRHSDWKPVAIDGVDLLTIQFIEKARVAHPGLSDGKNATE